jgi:hypothetical protein
MRDSIGFPVEFFIAQKHVRRLKSRITSQVSFNSIYSQRYVVLKMAGY